MIMSRKITFFDLSGIRKQLAYFCSHKGRPLVHPELLIRMLLVAQVTNSSSLQLPNLRKLAMIFPAQRKQRTL